MYTSLINFSHPVTKYVKTVYTSLINFHIQLQSMKQCIRLYKAVYPLLSISSYKVWKCFSVTYVYSLIKILPVTKYPVIQSHIQLQRNSVSYFVKSFLYKEWNSVSFYKLPSSYKVWNSVYFSIVTLLKDFHIQLQSMKQCIRLCKLPHPCYKIWKSV